MKPTTPLYKRVYQEVIERIVKGELGPGAMLPSETDLGGELGVSQGTARKALGELERKGIIQRRQGLGTFVATTTPESDLFHFFRLRNGDGSQVAPTLLTETINRRPVLEYEKNEFSECGEDVYELSRVRSVGTKPIVLETSVLPAVLFPGLDDRGPLPNTLYALFQKSYGIAIVKASEQLKAVLAGEMEAKILSIDVGTPLLEVNRNAIDITDRVIELRSSRYVTNDLHYEIALS